MIRYVLAAMLTVAIFGVAGLALEAGSADTTERELRTAVVDLEDAAVELGANEELSPAAHPDPQRVVEFTVPSGSLTEEAVDTFEIEPIDAAEASIATYVLEDGTRNQVVLDERIVYRDRTGNRTLEIDERGHVTIRLVLLPDEDGDPVVVADPPTRAADP